ncbi:MAG: hypothetical protein VX223_09910, partial [Myxococcota bacterium]|nr:hypothetical protein [Myxococcota bacterium]
MHLHRTAKPPVTIRGIVSCTSFHSAPRTQFLGLLLCLSWISCEATNSESTEAPNVPDATSAVVESVTLDINDNEAACTVIPTGSATFIWEVNGVIVPGVSSASIAIDTLESCARLTCRVDTHDGQPAAPNAIANGQVPPNSSCDDGNACTVATCDDEGSCIQESRDGTCDDGNACTEAGECQEGECIPGAVIDCDDGVFCNGQEVCDPILGCITATENPLEDGIACTEDLCNEETGEVLHIADDTACDDGLFCNGVESCSPNTGCVSGDAPKIDDGVDCTIDSCDDEMGEVVHIADDTACDDGAFCNGSEICSIDTGCVSGTAPSIDDAIACTIDSCDEAADIILHTADDAKCDDGAFCNGSEICSIDTGCLSGTAPSINDGVDCTFDSCDEAADVIVHTPVDAKCDDSAFCNGAETCSVDTGCLSGTAPSIDDGLDCTIDSCDEIENIIVHTPIDEAFSGTPGPYIEGSNTCGSGTCAAVERFATNNPSQSLGCTIRDSACTGCDADAACASYAYRGRVFRLCATNTDLSGA